MNWRRSRRIHIAAALCSLLAAASVFALFNRFGVVPPSTEPERQLIASIDLRIGNPAALAERGEARAKADLEAGLLQLQTFADAPADTAADKARARRLQERYGFAWVYKAATPTEISQAFADGYNRVMQAEIERRHGRELLDQLLREDKARPAHKEAAHPKEKTP